MGIKTLSATVISGLTLLAGGCEANAGAKNKPNEAVQVASMNVINRAKTQADCLKLNLKTNELIMTCMRNVTARESADRETEIAALDAQEKGLDVDNATIDQQIETEKEANDQRNTTVEVLSKENEELMSIIEARALSQDPTQ